MQSASQGDPKKGVKVGNGRADMDPESVFAALDRFVAETPLSSKLRVEAPEQSAPATPPATVQPAPDVSIPAEAKAAENIEPVVVTPSPQRPSAHAEGRIPAALLNTPNAILEADHVEMEVEPSEDHSKWGDRKTLVRIAIILLSVIVAIETFFLIRGRNAPTVPQASLASTGMLLVQSTPSGAAVFVNGQVRGVTPTTLTLSAGDHNIEVASGGVAKALPVNVQRGTLTTHHIFFGEAPVQGSLEITSQPSGQRVSIDGKERGLTPLTVSDLPAGVHAVLLDGTSGSFRQNVMIEAGANFSLAVTMPTVGASAGWMSVVSPFEVQLYEDGSLLGSSQSQRIMLPAGRHVIEAVNADLGYRATNTLQVLPGAVANLRLEVPPANLDINALPWAEVTISGKPLGTTPLGDVSVPIGTHELIFRHPQLGERTVNITVTVKGPNRVSINMNQR